MSENQKKHIAILGSTGNVGMQALDVIAANSSKFQVEVLTARSNADLLAAQALKFKANAVVIEDSSKYKALKDHLFDEGIKVFCGSAALTEVVEMETIDLVLNGLSGLSGLQPALKAIESGKNLLLGNTETLVVAGGLVTKTAREKGVNIYPVKPEHSSIFQCLAGEFLNPIEKVYLTSGGGPLPGKSLPEMADIHSGDALISKTISTINSASLMDTGFAVIEARWLFGLKPQQIDVVIHPQSIIHGVVQFEDGSMKAQMGMRDMKLPIQFALGYPERLKTESARFDFMEYPDLSFQKPDYKTFHHLQFAFDVMHKGGNAPCVLNAANDIAVQEFQAGNMHFLDMSDLIADCLDNTAYIAEPTLDDYFETDQETRAFALSKISTFN